MAQKMTEENKPYVMATLSGVAYKNPEEAKEGSLVIFVIYVVLVHSTSFPANLLPSFIPLEPWLSTHPVCSSQELIWESAEPILPAHIPK